MDADTHRQTLVVEEENVHIDSLSSEIRTFSKEKELIDYIPQNCKYVDLFDVYIHGRHIDCLLESGICQFEQVKRVTFFFDSVNDMEQAQQKLIGVPDKFKFCLTKEVANRIRNNHTFFDLISAYPQSQRSLKWDIEARRYQVQAKQQSLPVHGFSTASLPRVGFDARNISTIHEQFLCKLCSYILREPIQFSCCGIRSCKSCAENFYRLVRTIFI
jgi:hypothetical protein